MRLRRTVLASLLAAAAPLAFAQAAPAAGDPPAAEPLPAVKSNAALKGKRFYLAEYRVLFEVSGNVSANTRAAYFGGRDYGATRVSVNYKVPQPNLQLLQAITDKAHADFLARMAAAGLVPEPADAFVQANGAIYEPGAPGSRPGAEVHEDVELGYGKRKYLVMTPTGTRTVARGFIGLGAGNIGKRIEWSKGGMEGVSVSMVVNLAAQESSGGGSSMFKRGSSANASAAMEVAMAPKMGGVLQTHAQTQIVSLGGPWPVAGQFATLRETGGYDSASNPVVSGINMLGKLTMGVAGNNSKRVDMALEVDEAALAELAGKALSAVNQAVVGAIQ
ncbi:MAG: hypothetical protein V4864_24350 [Pseudomonadota bacterium]